MKWSINLNKNMKKNVPSIKKKSNKKNTAKIFIVT